MIIAADDMRDLHLRVVDDDDVVVNRHSRRAHDDRIAHDFVGKLDRAVHDVMKLDRPLGNVKADGATLAAGASLERFCGIDLPAFAGVVRWEMRGESFLAFDLELLGRTETEIRLALA